jgi:hypothetical protein
MISVPAPFPRRTIVAVHNDYIILGTNEGPFVDLLRREDSTWTRIEWMQTMRPVQPQQMEDFVASLVDRASSGRELLREILSAAEPPKELPWYDAILVADDGALWTRDYVLPFEENSIWRVLSQAGELLAIAKLPSAFMPRSVRGDELLGIHTDSLDVERVMKVRLR